MLTKYIIFLCFQYMYVGRQRHCHVHKSPYFIRKAREIAGGLHRNSNSNGRPLSSNLLIFKRFLFCSSICIDLQMFTLFKIIIIFLAKYVHTVFIQTNRSYFSLRLGKHNKWEVLKMAYHWTHLRCLDFSEGNVPFTSKN